MALIRTHVLPVETSSLGHSIPLPSILSRSNGVIQVYVRCTYVCLMYVYYCIHTRSSK